jgi:hypothetical protein
VTKESSEDSFVNYTLQKKTHKTNKRKLHNNELFGEFKKIGPPSFDKELEEGEKAWLLLNMGKYFHINNYPRNLRA